MSRGRPFTPEQARELNRARWTAAKEIDRLADKMSHQDAAHLRHIALRLMFTEPVGHTPSSWEVASWDA